MVREGTCQTKLSLAQLCNFRQIRGAIDRFNMNRVFALYFIIEGLFFVLMLYVTCHAMTKM